MLAFLSLALLLLAPTIASPFVRDIPSYSPSAPKPSAAKCAAVPPMARANCAYWGVDRQQCEARGCCFGAAGAFTPTEKQQEPPPTFQHACFYSDAAVPITKVHVVQSNHFDAGYHDIVGSQLELAFTEWIPRAIKLGKELKAMGGAETIRWMGQSWIFDLYLNCPPNAGLTCPSSAAVSEFKQAVRAGTITWHAFPHNAELEVLSAFGLQNGINQSHALDDVFALPHKTTLSVRDVPGIPRGAIAPASVAGVHAFSIGANGRIVPPLLPPAFIWRDEQANNVSALVWFHAFGYGHDPAVFSRRRAAQQKPQDEEEPQEGGAPPIPPDGPIPQPPYMASNHGPEYVVVPGCSEALVYDWRGDNTGPPDTILEVLATWKKVQSWWPHAEVVASDLDAFTAAAAPHAYSTLPVVTKELGDTWVMGVPSDPLKVAQMRAMDRNLISWPHASDGSEQQQQQQQQQDPALVNFSRYWVKNSEHTWGVSVQHFAQMQRTGWNNSVFRPALKAAAAGGDDDPESAGNIYSTLQKSWVDQFHWGLDWAMAALPTGHPLERALTHEFALMAPNQTDPEDGSWTPLTTPPPPVSPGENASVSVIQRIGDYEIGFDTRGAIVHLSSVGSSGAAAAKKTWATLSHPLALLRYQSLSDATFGTQMRESYLFRHPDDAPGNSSRISGANEYGKPGVDEDAKPLDQVVEPTLRGAYRRRRSSTGTASSSSSIISGARAAEGLQMEEEELLLDVRFPASLCDHYGAPASALLTISSRVVVNSGGNATAASAPPPLQLRLELVDKRPTRLPEATWLQFHPPPSIATRPTSAVTTTAFTGTTGTGDDDSAPPRFGPEYSVNKLGNWVDPLGVVDGGAKSLHGFSPSGPSLIARWPSTADTMTVTSLDAGVVRFDRPFPTPTPIFRQPDTAGYGAHFALHMNTWCAECVHVCVEMSRDVFMFCVHVQEYKLPFLVAVHRGQGLGGLPL